MKDINRRSLSSMCFAQIVIIDYLKNELVDREKKKQGNKFDFHKFKTEDTTYCVLELAANKLRFAEWEIKYSLPYKIYAKFTRVVLKAGSLKEEYKRNMDDLNKQREQIQNTLSDIIHRKK